MSRSAPRVCCEPGCPTLVDGGGRCLVHVDELRKQNNRKRRGVERHHYSSAQWGRHRGAVLRATPTCPCGNPSTVADHVVPRRILIAAGVEDVDAVMWLQALCKPCHDRKTQLVDVPLLKRLDAGEDPATVAEDVVKYGTQRADDLTGGGAGPPSHGLPGRDGVVQGLRDA